MPSAFRATLESAYGRELFVTSTDGHFVRLYPMPVWEELEGKLAKMPPSHPSRGRFLDWSNYYGQVTEIDSQGRVLIPARLRESASITSDVEILGKGNYLDAWQHERLWAKLQSAPYTDADALFLAEHGI